MRWELVSVIEERPGALLVEVWRAHVALALCRLHFGAQTAPKRFIYWVGTIASSCRSRLVAKNNIFMVRLGTINNTIEF